MQWDVPAFWESVSKITNAKSQNTLTVWNPPEARFILHSVCSKLPEYSPQTCCSKLEHGVTAKPHREPRREHVHKCLTRHSQLWAASAKGRLLVPLLATDGWRQATLLNASLAMVRRCPVARAPPKFWDLNREPFCFSEPLPINGWTECWAGGGRYCTLLWRVWTAS